MMDLPETIAAARATYKRHTEIVKSFINNNGGRTVALRDWDFAPHLVAEHLGARGIPSDLKSSLKKAIKNRKVVAKHYQEKRKIQGSKLCGSDLRHLIFIDRLETIQRIWFPASPSLDPTPTPTNTQEAYDAMLEAFRGLSIGPRRIT